VVSSIYPLTILQFAVENVPLIDDLNDLRKTVVKLVIFHSYADVKLLEGNSPKLYSLGH
jgi:hypothetical protein